jgi:hypothetical protein
VQFTFQLPVYLNSLFIPALCHLIFFFDQSNIAKRCIGLGIIGVIFDHLLKMALCCSIVTLLIRFRTCCILIGSLPPIKLRFYRSTPRCKRE